MVQASNPARCCASPGAAPPGTAIERAHRIAELLGAAATRFGRVRVRRPPTKLRRA
jgi:hypothetical protein